jgi:hypothetical protein
MLTLRLVPTSFSDTVLQSLQTVYDIHLPKRYTRCCKGPSCKRYTMYECLFVYLSRLRAFLLDSPLSFLRTAPYKHHMHKTIESQGKRVGGQEVAGSRLEIRGRHTDTCSSRLC